MRFMIDPGEKGYKLPEQILCNSLVLYLTLLVCSISWWPSYQVCLNYAPETKKSPGPWVTC